jgi:formylglycine-generating enzyme required for sulfatase activity
MSRISAFGFVVCAAILAPIHAQTKATSKEARKESPKESSGIFTNSIGMRFVWIHPGTFSMGSPKQEKARNILETQHTVKLTRGFYMAAYPVTQEQWHDVMASEYARPVEGFDMVVPSRFDGGKKLPVEMISWNDCQAFIGKLRKRDKRAYRLPTEAEWEYACRAGTTTPFNVGETISTSQANFSASYGKGNRQKTTPVGSFPPNAWGLYDMHGNVAQWCQDRFAKYPQSAVVDPQGPEKGGNRILRGGSWEDAPGRIRSAARGWESQDSRGLGNNGFRLCFFPD